MGDELFNELLTTTNYSEYLRKPLRQMHSELMDRLGWSDRIHFVMDFSPMQDIEPYPGMFVAPTVTLFTRDESD